MNIKNKNKIIISNILLSIIIFTSCVFASTTLYSNNNSNVIVSQSSENNYPTDADGVIIIDDPWFYATLDQTKFPTAKSVETSAMVVLNEKQLQTLHFAVNSKGTTVWKRYEPNHKVSYSTIISPEAYIDDTEISNITYIRYTDSVAVVDDYYQWELTADNKWKLIVMSGDLITTYARNGFYKIADKTYYIDNDGYMVTGIMKDEYNYIYTLSDTGELVSVVKGE